jgi:hypothetical protein
MDTVQELRRRAQATGHLSPTDQYAVYDQGGAVVVEPRTEVVYVRYYDPYVVYGPWWWPYYRPVFWRPWAPHPVFVTHGFFFVKPDWHRRHVHVAHRPVHVHPRQHAHVVPGRWQHTARAVVRQVQQPRPTVVRPHVRVPEAQRRPIVNSMPAASGFSAQRGAQAQHPRRSIEQRGRAMQQQATQGQRPRSRGIGAGRSRH